MNDEKVESLPIKKSAAVARKEYINTIADKIQSLVRDEHFLPSDIMVLVQRRNPFASPLVNELKSRDIDVAGSDRIVLPNFPAIRDMLNLLRFCIDPTDNYWLCCTLKSPIYRLKEEDILNICIAQQNANKDAGLEPNQITVFNILEKMHPEIFADLTQIIEWSKVLAPYSFFIKLLNSDNRREKIIAALGTQIIDPLEEFLTICLAYERTMPGTLKHFLKWFITGGSEIKRDMDASNGVRVVTVHGSKGLESKIVFLIDTVRTPRDKSEKIFMLESSVGAKNPAWLWVPQKTNSEKMDAIAETSLNKKISEYYRLLYVAMTRARDRLYIYGFTTNKNSHEVSWHNQLINIIKDMPNVKFDGDIIKV